MAAVPEFTCDEAALDGADGLVPGEGVFYGRVDRAGKLELKDREKFRSFLAEECRGSFVEIAVWTIDHPATAEARQYYFKSVVQELSKSLGNTMPEQHRMLKEMFLRIENDPVTGAVRSRHLPRDQRRLWLYVEDCIEFATIEHGLTIAPRPKPFALGRLAVPLNEPEP